MTAAHLCGIHTSVVFTKAPSCSSHLFCCITINVSPPTRHPQLTSAAASLSHLHLQPWGLNTLPVYGFYVSKRMTRECWQRHTFIPFIHFFLFVYKCQTPPCLVTHTDNSIHLPNFLSCNLYIQPRRLSCCWCESVTANGTGRSCIQPSLHTSTLIRPLKWPRFPV